MKQMDYFDTIEFVNKLLSVNTEWILRYANYTKKIATNLPAYVAGRKKFRINSPLYLYTSISNLLKINVPTYDLRFLGQSVASVKIKNNGIIITTNKNKDSSNIKFFGIDKPLKNENWDSFKATKFRSSFRKCTSSRGHSYEHKIESGLLSEFHSDSKSKKALYNIQPVLLANIFFQMATPLKASLSDIVYSKSYGGGIDILARVKHKNNSVRLCVMELKDENRGSEPIEKVMNQAVAYATFIANLLRSDSGNEWYKIFGFSGDVPKQLTIDVSTVMPYPSNNQLYDFNKSKFEVLEDTHLELYSLYFKEKSKFVDGKYFEFEGSLKEAMMK